MAKRLTDSGKWDDPWFLDLTSDEKLVWLYMLDKCDHAGIWKVNKRLAAFCLSLENFDWDGFRKRCNGRIEDLGPEKWFIPKFIEFQYGALQEQNRAHASVLSLLKKEGAYKLLTRGLEGDKEKVKEQVNHGGKSERGDFSLFWAAYPKKKSKGQAERAWEKLNPDEQLTARIMAAIQRAKTSESWAKEQGKFIPHPATWLNAKGWEDSHSVEITAAKPTKGCPSCGGGGYAPGSGRKCYCWR